MGALSASGYRSKVSLTIPIESARAQDSIIGFTGDKDLTDAHFRSFAQLVRPTLA
jgi:hypothetical protein